MKNIQRMYLVQRVEKRKTPRTNANPTVDDLYSMDYMGSAEYEFGALPKSLKRICREVENFKIVTFPVKDFKGRNLQAFIHNDIKDTYVNEIVEFLDNKRHLKERIDLEYLIKGTDWMGRPIEDCNDQLFWDIDNDVWFSFIPGEMKNVESAILNVIIKKQSEGITDWGK